jgi:hypothetical protein
MYKMTPVATGVMKAALLQPMQGAVLEVKRDSWIGDIETTTDRL